MKLLDFHTSLTEYGFLLYIKIFPFSLTILTDELIGFSVSFHILSVSINLSINPNDTLTTDY